MSDNKTDSRRRHVFSFAVRTLLAVVACVAAYLAGHRVGFHAGYTKASAEYGDEGIHGYYDVSDLVIPLSDDDPAMWSGGIRPDADEQSR